MKKKISDIILGVACFLTCQHGVAVTQLPDSLLTFDKAYYYNIVDMPKSLQIIKTMRERKMAPEWELDRAEANLWSLDRHYNKALKLYKKVLDNPEAHKSWNEELSTLFLTIYCYDKLNDERHLSRLVLRMRELAEEHQATAYMYMADFMRGKRLYLMRKKPEGYKFCEQAVEHLKHTDYQYRNRMLFIFYNTLANLYINDGKYAKALKAIAEAEEAIRQGLNMRVLEVERRASTVAYATKTRLYAAEGQMSKADSTFALMRAIPYRDIGAEASVIPYLKKSGKYDDMLASAKYCRKIIEEDGNKIGQNMLWILKEEIDAYMGLRQFEAAATCYSALTQLTDSLHVDNLNYFSKEARADIQHQKITARRNLQFSIGIAILIILTLVFIATVYLNLLTRKRNKAMMSTIHELMYYRNLALHTCDPSSVEMDENSDSPHNEKCRFKEMDKRIIKEELFRNPDFGREDLMRLMGVDKNAIASIVQKYAHTNVSGYIKMKRMEYAINLLKGHPELTIAAIAEMSGIRSTTTFVNYFKDSYGMKPSDFRLSTTL